ncbi:MAG: peptide-methionine (R)-S-oxide reductase [Candidatus Latescibacterota bacterium]|jgi:peptide-methionine (R)-S-oxide reductase
MGEEVADGDDQWRQKLTEEQYEVARCGGTESAFTGKYWDHKGKGIYRCVCCDNELFRSESKYDSGSGWPSFWQPIADERVDEKKDTSHGMVRVEAQCSGCGAHLGHVFPDGPPPTGLRYCMNSASLDFAAEE